MNNKHIGGVSSPKPKSQVKMIEFEGSREG